MNVRLALPCCCCCPSPAVLPETTNTHHFFYINPHITHNNNKNGNNIHFPLPILFFLTYIPHYHPLIFQLIYSPNGHHEFNFLSPFILFFYFLKIKTHFMKGKGKFLPLTWLNFCYFLNLAETVNTCDSLTSPQSFTHIWSSRTPN